MFVFLLLLLLLLRLVEHEHHEHLVVLVVLVADVVAAFVVDVRIGGSRVIVVFVIIVEPIDG